MQVCIFQESLKNDFQGQIDIPNNTICVLNNLGSDSGHSLILMPLRVAQVRSLLVCHVYVKNYYSQFSIYITILLTKYYFFPNYLEFIPTQEIRETFLNRIDNVDSATQNVPSSYLLILQGVGSYLYHIKAGRIKAKQNMYGGKTKHFQDVARGGKLPSRMGQGVTCTNTGAK